MKTSDFDFELPEELIARYPLSNRTDSRLLVVNNKTTIEHKVFSELPSLLAPNDVLIFNNTRVIPARLLATKTTGGKVEILIERILSTDSALAHVKSNKSLKLPMQVVLTNGVLVTLKARQEDLFELQFHSDLTLRQLLDEVGEVPLPPYMQRSAESLDVERYQTVYSLVDGAVAAPTAGLHFDTDLIASLNRKGIKHGYITLHVGAGTFKPVTVENYIDHKMHKEWFEISPEVCELVNQARANGGRVIAVGTTTVRALETAMRGKTELQPCANETRIFIYPGYRFAAIDCLITNFHLPKSTLLMLVCALGGYNEVMLAYRAAIDERYRFYSYGDAMFVEMKS